MEIKEIWKDIVWYEGRYQVSNLWNVKSLSYTIQFNAKPWLSSRNYKEILLKYKYIKWWYKSISLRKNSINSNFLVHRLVYCTFNNIDVKFNKYKNCICHKDDNPDNCNLYNLFLWTQSDNMKDCFRKWRWRWYTECKKVNQYDLQWNFIKTRDSLSKIEQKLWIDTWNMSKCCKKIWRYKSLKWYKWEYA